MEDPQVLSREYRNLGILRPGIRDEEHQAERKRDGEQQRQPSPCLSLNGKSHD